MEAGEGVGKTWFPLTTAMNVGYFTVVTFASNHLDAELEKPKITADCGAPWESGRSLSTYFQGLCLGWSVNTLSLPSDIVDSL